MQIHKMSDASATAGGPGFQDLPIRVVTVPHPVIEGVQARAYECEFTFDQADLTKVLDGGRLRICIIAPKVVPISVAVVGPNEA